MYLSTVSIMERSTVEQFCKVAAVLEKFVAAAPRPVSLEGIVRDLDMEPGEARVTCRLLLESGLLSPACDYECWTLAKDQGAVTLEDVWSSLSTQGDPVTPTRAGKTVCLAPETELLVAQAFMELQQSIRHLLRRFQLDRVSVSRTGGTACFRQTRNRIRAEEVALES
ncbi:MAG TPA: hypothetical protein VEC35_00545 [Noviherbaspirillum sp.]|nr:hypothetical protein [Noviherbaspirillum sp.]